MPVAVLLMRLLAIDNHLLEFPVLFPAKFSVQFPAEFSAQFPALLLPFVLPVPPRKASSGHFAIF